MLAFLFLKDTYTGEGGSLCSLQYIKRCQEDRDPHSSSFWVPRNLSNNMVKHASTGDTLLVKSREMTDRTVVAVRRRDKDDRKQNTITKKHWPR